MKILILNTWRGKCVDEITDYLKLIAEEFDIYILQEVDDNMRLICDNVLCGYYKIIDSKLSNNNGSIYNQAVYFKNKFTLIDDCVIDFDNLDIGCLQYICLKDEKGVIYNIVNVHGLTFHGDTKLDSKDRLVQSNEIIDCLKGKEGVRIIAGDFNILRDTESIKMFSLNGYQNLISDYNIFTTRNKNCWDRFETKMFDSDYVFVDNGTKVNQFIVEDNLVSDHLPMILEV